MIRFQKFTFSAIFFIFYAVMWHELWQRAVDEISFFIFFIFDSRNICWIFIFGTDEKKGMLDRNHLKTVKHISMYLYLLWGSFTLLRVIRVVIYLWREVQASFYFSLLTFCEDAGGMATVTGTSGAALPMDVGIGGGGGRRRWIGCDTPTAFRCKCSAPLAAAICCSSVKLPVLLLKRLSMAMVGCASDGVVDDDVK